MNNLDLYNELSDNWWAIDSPFASLRALNGPRFKYFSEFVPSFAGLRVLDVGCGGGFTSEELSKRGAHVTGIDLSESSLKVARAHALAGGLDIKYLNANAENLPFDAAHFDCVVCVDVLEHLPKVPKVLKEVRRVLKTQGCFFFDTFNRNIFSHFVAIRVLENWLKSIPKGTHDPSMFIKPKEMKLFCEMAGLSLENVRGFAPVSYSWKSRSFELVPKGPPLVLYGGMACAS
jgi:2-polyprenyl-6-hydroxyphenyl methylase / 3-demethylubiquinone-9 3-methyltransferase